MAILLLALGISVIGFIIIEKILIYFGISQKYSTILTIGIILFCLYLLYFGDR